MILAASSSSRFLGASGIVDPKPPKRRGNSVRISASAHVPASERSPSSSSLYEVLGISAGSTSADVRSAYRRLARTCHPDAGAAAEEFVRIHAAYSTLSDPDSRAEYDRTLVVGRRRFSSPSASASGSGSGSSSSPRSTRTWETDQCW